MNISRYANIDKFVHIRYIFLLARRAYIQLIISASTNVEITSPGRRASGFLTLVPQHITEGEQVKDLI